MGIVKSKFSGYRADGSRHYGFGGGGDSGSNYYANQDRLLGTQADIAQGIYNNIYQPYAPGAVGKLAGMVDEANSGALTARARDQAGADAGQAIGSAISAGNRNLSRYGLDPHKLSADSNSTALAGAALKTDAMNKAGQWGENQKWARTYDFYNSLSGVPSQTTSTLGSAASGYGSMGANASNQDNAEAAGYGRAGSLFGKTLFARDGGMVKMKCGGNVVRRMKRGGMVKRQIATGGEIRMAGGGLMKLPDWRTTSTAGSRRGGADPAEAFVSSALTAAAGEAIKGAGKQALSGVGDAIAKGVGQAAGNVTSRMGIGLGNSGVAAPVSDAVITPVGGAAVDTGVTAGGTQLAGQAATNAATTAATDAAATEAATQAATTAATETAAATAAETAVAANAWNPVGWVGAGLMAANALFAKNGGMVKMANGGRFEIASRGPGVLTAHALGEDVDHLNNYQKAASVAGDPIGTLYFSKGGGMRRKDMTPGGQVRGPGGPTEDKVPAMLSNGEFVLNAKAVELVGEGKLNEINNAGLAQRDAKTTMEGGQLHAAGGLGIALGAGVDEYHRLKADDRADEYAKNVSQAAKIQNEHARMAQDDFAKNRSDMESIRQAMTAGAKAESSIPDFTGTATAAPKAEGMSADPNATPSVADSMTQRPAQTDIPGMSKVTPESMTAGWAQPVAQEGGMKRKSNTLDEERQFSSLKSGYEHSMKIGRPDLAMPLYAQMVQTRDTLMAKAMDRADRQYRATGGQDISGFINNYNRYVADGQTIESYKANDDGSLSVALSMNGSPATIQIKREEIPDYIAFLRDPAAIRAAEAARAKKFSDAQLKAWEEQQKPIKVGKDETVVYADGKSFSPNGGGMSVKDAGSVLDDTRKILQQNDKNFTFGNTPGAGVWTSDGLKKASLAERLFLANPTLPPAMLADIANNGEVIEQLQVNKATGETRRVQAVSSNGKAFPLGAADSGTPIQKTDSSGDVPQSVMRRFGGLQSNFQPTRSTMGSPTPIAKNMSGGGREASGMISGMQRMPTSFPTNSPDSNPAQRDIEMGKIRVQEAGGVDEAKKAVAEINAQLASPRLDGTQRQILTTERDRLVAGINALQS